jgi:hypothetical protein
MGTESVFASILFGKILRKIAKSMFYQESFIFNEANLKTLLKTIIKELIDETKLVKNQLGLETNELLSTIILGVINTDNSEAEFITIGDGLIIYDGKIIEYEQNDKPDYLDYHLNKDFEKWYNNQTQCLSVSKFQNLAICTDGIFTFKNFKEKQKQKSELEIINYILENEDHSDSDNFLNLKIKTLKEQMNHVLTDDLAIIRVMN